MIDIHIHTIYSDGTDSVEELLKKAEDKQLEVISITDHDEVGSYFELEKDKKLRNLYSGKIIIGAELKTVWNRVPIEILAYGIDYKKLRIHKINMKELQKEVLEKLKKVARNLGLIYDEKNVYIDENDPTKRFGSFTIGTELLKHKENLKKIKEIGEFVPTSFYRVHQSNKNSPFYVDETYASIDIDETISRIHEAGGLAFLAHGYIYPFDDKDKIIEEILSTTNIDGMECVYTEFSEEERKKAMRFCKKYNKFMSGGSDYHAKNKPDINLGTGRNNNMKIEKSLIESWINKVRYI